jgi:hypothetical protein
MPATRDSRSRRDPSPAPRSRDRLRSRSRSPRRERSRTPPPQRARSPDRSARSSQHVAPIRRYGAGSLFVGNAATGKSCVVQVCSGANTPANKGRLMVYDHSLPTTERFLGFLDNHCQNVHNIPGAVCVSSESIILNKHSIEGDVADTPSDPTSDNKPSGTATADASNAAATLTSSAAPAPSAAPLVISDLVPLPARPSRGRRPAVKATAGLPTRFPHIHQELLSVAENNST